MSETTSINDLPTDPAGGGGSNISLSATEQRMIPNSGHSSGPPPPGNMSNNNNNNNISLDQTTISQIVNGLQQATIAGATKLPSRDIPMTTSVHTQDPYVQPNYVPVLPPSMGQYIDPNQTNQDIMNEYSRNQQRSHVLDDMYNEIQTPLLLGVLYFLFQLPFFKRNLSIYLPALFASDGNMNLNGYIFNSILFGLLFYMMNKIMSHFETF